MKLSNELEHGAFVYGMTYETYIDIDHRVRRLTSVELVHACPVKVLYLTTCTNKLCNIKKYSCGNEYYGTFVNSPFIYLFLTFSSFSSSCFSCPPSFLLLLIFSVSSAGVMWADMHRLAERVELAKLKAAGMLVVMSRR